MGANLPPYSAKTCFCCKKEGHVAKVCPVNEPNNYGLEMGDLPHNHRCFLCKNHGHVVGKCPLKSNFCFNFFSEFFFIRI